MSGPSGSIPPRSGSSNSGAPSPRTNGPGPTASASRSTGGSTWWAGAPCGRSSPPTPGTRPELIRFHYGPRGKPFLESPAAGGLQFNLSNSDELALVGFVLGPEIGVDVEYLKPMPDCEQISERFFSESERKVLRGIPFPVKEEAFFNCWTRKEAYLKAVGEGLAAPLDSFDVTLAPGEPPRMLTLKGDAERAARWFFHHFRPAPDYIGALAIEGGEWDVKTWEMV